MHLVARDWANEALVYSQKIGYRRESGNALIERGRCFWQSGDPVSAENDLRSAAEILAGLGAAFDLARVRFLLAALQHTTRSAEAEQTWLAAAESILQGGYVFLPDQERTLAYPLLAKYHSHFSTETARLNSALIEQLLRTPPPSLHVTALGSIRSASGCAAHRQAGASKTLCRRTAVHAGDCSRRSPPPTRQPRLFHRGILKRRCMPFTMQLPH